MKKASAKVFKRSGRFFVYILECKDGTYYTGYTSDLERRLGEHNNGKRGAKYLRGKTPVEFVYAKEHRNYKNAMKAERDIKKRTRMEKEAMVRAHAKPTDKFAPHPPSCFLRKQESRGISGGLTPKCLSVYIKTFGCQMNSRDSEEITGMFLEKGYVLSGSAEDADIVIFNTCSVREHAEERAISNIGELKIIKKKSPHMIIGIAGCMAKARKEELFKKLPHVDFICAPANMYEIPGIIEGLIQNRKRPNDEIASLVASLLSRNDSYRPAVTDYVSAVTGKGHAILAIDKEIRPEIKNIAYHKKGVSALVTIMEGCNNFCSYCIVPYVRGREVARPADDIIDEIKKLADQGYKEVTLLGQNVNSYGNNTRNGVSPNGTSPFVDLLERIDEVGGIERIRFLTSHPKDAGEDLFKAMRDLDKVCEHLHLPLQSGSDRILKSMNRGYTASDYLKKIETLRKYVPDCALTTDVIVGYPGETDEDFMLTKKLMEDAGFNSAFVFKYSPRPPAKASVLYDDVPMKVKEERNQVLLKLRDKISGLKDKEFIGGQTEVLVENICRKEKHKVAGRNRQNIKTVFEGASPLIGAIKKVKISSVVGHTLAGSAVTAMLFCAISLASARAETAEEYFVKGDYENAAREGVKGLDASKERDKTRYVVGTSLNKLGRYEPARENFKFLIENYPKSVYAPLAQLGIADSYYLNADYQDAAEAYERYITGYPKSGAAATAYFRLGKCAQKEGEWRSARNYYQKVKAEYPLSFEAQAASRALSEEMLYFTVQVGSFGKKSNALKLCDELTKKGYDASILKAQSDGREAYRVRVGMMNTRNEAEELAKRLEAEGLPVKILP